MKRVLIIILLFICIGCSNNIACIKKDDNGILTDEVLKLSFDGEKLKKIKQSIVMEFKDEYKKLLSSTYEEVKKEYKNYKEKDGYSVGLKKEDNKIFINLKFSSNDENNGLNKIIDTSKLKDDIIKQIKSKGYICK